MRVPIDSFRDLRHSTLSLILLVAFAGIAGCGSDHSSGGLSSPPDWVVVPSGGLHAKSATLSYIANGGISDCAECHGADLSGGTSKVSCFGNPAGCHHGTVAGWDTAAVHGASAKKAPGNSGFAACQVCHGGDFSGGGAGVPCFTCHRVGAPHSPKPWRSSTGGANHTSTDPENAAVCIQCHFPGSPNNPAGHPSTPAPAGTPPGCHNNTLCHGAGEAPHAVPFPGTTHTAASQTTFTADCSACHAVTGISPVSTAPTCSVCHEAGSPLTNANCSSCHGKPPAGTTYPNVAGKHAVHGALPGVGVCNPCHNGLGTGTLEHYNRANALPGKDALRVAPGDIAFLTNYNAKSGAADFTAADRTCSNVICHGGQATPDWQTATANAIDVPNACLACHVSGTTQYNSYFSGKHASHIDNVFGLSATTCKRCHDEVKVNVSGHFQNLATSAFEQRPKDTILPAVQYNKGACNPQEGGLTGCHGSRKW